VEWYVLQFFFINTARFVGALFEFVFRCLADRSTASIAKAVLSPLTRQWLRLNRPPKRLLSMI